jgi:hypothetical protein
MEGGSGRAGAGWRETQSAQGSRQSVGRQQRRRRGPRTGLPPSAISAPRPTRSSTR